MTTTPAPVDATTPRTGGRSGMTTAEAIAHHARHMFADQGFAATSVRAVAARAGVDPALVIRHFHSKEELFLRVMGLVDRPLPPTRGPADTLGQRMVAWLVAAEHRELRRDLTTLVRASDYAAVRGHLREMTRQLFIEQLVATLPGPDAELRARLIASQLHGLVQTLALDEHPPTAGQTQRVIELYGAAVQRLVDDPRSCPPPD